MLPTDGADAIAKDLLSAGLVEGRELVVGMWSPHYFVYFYFALLVP